MFSKLCGFGLLLSLIIIGFWTIKKKKKGRKQEISEDVHYCFSVLLSQGVSFSHPLIRDSHPKSSVQLAKSQSCFEPRSGPGNGSVVLMKTALQTPIPFASDMEECDRPNLSLYFLLQAL